MKKFFDDRLGSESVALRLIRRIIITAAVIHFSLAAISGYRAWVQVKALNIESSYDTLGPGASIAVDAVTSGRNPVSVSLEAIQNGVTHRLASVTVPENKNRFYDPRSQRERFVVVMTPEILKTFSEGPVLLRARGEGRSQFLRVPPPTIYERESVISWTEAIPADVAENEDDTMCLAARVGLPCG